MGGLGRRLHMNPCWLKCGFAMIFGRWPGMADPRRHAFLGGVVCRAAAADAPLDPGAVRQALATVALGAFVLGACCACACAAACWCASIAYDADGGGGGPFSARRVLAAPPLPRSALLRDRRRVATRIAYVIAYVIT